MNEDYLWDRTGPPDEEIVRLEEVLGRLRYSKRNRRINGRLLLAAAAALLVSIGAGLMMRHNNAPTNWRLIIGDKQATQVRRGQLIETDGKTTATLESQDVGEVRIEPGSKLRLTKAAKSAQQLALERGVIHAFIWAPPTQFVVDTPGAKTIDLGCQYTLKVGPDGSGELTVTLGWVAFQSGKLESFIPAGAKCRTRPGRGPGTPYSEDAPKAFIRALDRFDTNADGEALNTVTQTARPKDGLTLWHLLSRTQGVERAKVYAALASRVKLPADVTQEAILRGDPHAMDDAWNALQLGDTSWWRIWKRRF